MPAIHRPNVTFNLLVDGVGYLGDRHVAGRTLTGSDPIAGDIFILRDEAETARWQVEAVWYPSVFEFPSLGQAWVAAMLIAPGVNLRLVA